MDYNQDVFLSNSSLYDFNSLLQDFHEHQGDVMLKTSSSKVEKSWETSGFLLASSSNMLRDILLEFQDPVENPTIVLADFSNQTVDYFMSLLLSGQVCCNSQEEVEELHHLTESFGINFTTDYLDDPLIQDQDGSESAEGDPRSAEDVKRELNDSDLPWDDDENDVESCPESDVEELPIAKRSRMKGAFHPSSTGSKKVQEGNKIRHKCSLCGQILKQSWDRVTVHLHKHILDEVKKTPDDRLEILKMKPSKMQTLPDGRISYRRHFDCAFCHRCYTNRERLVQHLEEHIQMFDKEENFRNFCCRPCKLRFGTVTEYFLHVQIHEQEYKAEQQCPHCKMMCIHPVALGRHKSKEHPGAQDPPHEEGLFPCPICPKKLKNEVVLGWHTRLHTLKVGLYDASLALEEASADAPRVRVKKESAYTCDICGFTTATAKRLRSHAQRHVSVKRHRCPMPLCGKSFTLKYLYENHILKHKGEKNVLCDVCGKEFVSVRYMKNHKAMVHSKMFEYQCRICTKKLKVWQSARKHVLMHSETPPFHCTLCGMSFTYIAEIEKHRKEGHPGMKFSIKKVLLPEHNELFKKAIKKIPPEPIPNDYKPGQIDAKTHNEWRKRKLADMMEDEDSGQEVV